MSTPIEDLRKSVDNFALAMGAKLLVNNEKNGWSNVSMEFLFDELRKHVTELERGVAVDESPTHILSAAADVGNFAMMIAENAGR